MSSFRTVAALSMMALAGCTGNLGEDGALSSSALATAPDGAIFVADADNGELLKVNTTTQEVSKLVVGSDPRRVVRVADQIFVTLSAEGSIAVVNDTAAGLVLEGVYPVGAEPFGIVAAPNGEQLYVAISMEDAVVELDLASMEETRRFRVPGQPRWVAMHPNGKKLFVASAMEGVLVRIDLSDGDTRPLSFPETNRETFTQDEFGGRNEVVDLTPRVTGDLAVSPAGDVLAVPTLFVDNATSVGSADPMADGSGTRVEDGRTTVSQGYASGNIENGLTRFNPSLVTIPLNDSGEPNDHLGTAVLMAGRAPITANDENFFEREHFEEHLLDPDFTGAGKLVRGYLSSVVFDPRGHMMLATIEGAGTVAAIPTYPTSNGFPSEFDDFLGHNGFEGNQLFNFVGTDAGAAALAFTDEDTVWSYSFIGRSLSEIDYGRVEGNIEKQAMGEHFNTSAWFEGASVELGPSLLPPDIEEGRRLFFSATDSAMATAGAGVSCATCHFDGRNDGLTWQFDHGPRQTPSLAGKVSLTAPVTWTNEVESVATEAFITSQGRMGGHGINAIQTAEISAFIDFTRDPDVRSALLDPAAVARGKALFESAETACATCHSGERYTNNESYAMVGLDSVNTPGLVSVAATAPYLHDGSAKTLRDVIDRADEIGMGSTAHLSDADKADLELYLRSL